MCYVHNQCYDISCATLYLAEFFLEREMFQPKIVEKVKTHISYPRTYFRKLCLL